MWPLLKRRLVELGGIKYLALDILRQMHCIIGMKQSKCLRNFDIYIMSYNTGTYQN